MAEPLRPVLEVPDEDGSPLPPVSAVSPSSSRRSQISPIKDFSPKSLFRRIGYHRMPSDGGVQEMASFGGERDGREEEEDGGGGGEGEEQDLDDRVHHRLQSPPMLPHPSPPPVSSPRVPLSRQHPPSHITDGLGISMYSNEHTGVTSRSASSHRVPVGSKITSSSSPDTPRSHHGLIGSPDPSAMPWSTPVFHTSSSSSGGGPDSAPPIHVVHSPHQTTRHANAGKAQNSKTYSETITKLFSPTRWPYSKKQQAHVRVTNASTPATTSSSGPNTPGNPDSIDFLDEDDNVDDFDDEKFYKGYSEPPSYCQSKRDIHARRRSWLSLTIFTLSIYSTLMSGIWFIVAVLEPRWGRGISSRHGLHPSTATTVAALVAKSIEMSFVTVFISCLGQVLTRRALVRNAKGMTLAEMTMRNWVIQPGSLITHGETLPTAGMTVFGALALTATVAATFYTTASDAMVAPKLKYGGWESRILEGNVRSSYANTQYAKAICPGLVDSLGEDTSGESCMNVQFSGQSYRNLMNFMSVWSGIHDNGTGSTVDMIRRPPGTTLLFDNTTMVSSWIDTHNSNVTQLFEEYDGRIVNNVTMAMPHPGVYTAATSSHNGILQPDELAGVGEYSVRAAVVSPSINVLCVNMDREELEPLVYTEWPDALTNNTNVVDQVIGWPGWESEVPLWGNDDEGDEEYLNRTDVDDIFRWGPEYGRKPPVFQLYPADFNLLTNASVHASDAIYLLGKSPAHDAYTLCELKSFLSPNCSTQLDISGITGATMRAHCEDPDDDDSYLRSHPKESEWPAPAMDWKNLADAWRLSMDLNGGTYNNNASNARILTQLSLFPSSSSSLGSLPQTTPSMAEALAVYASSTLIVGAIDTPFHHYWPYLQPILNAPGPLQPFNASLRTQQYTSGHVAHWQNIFHVVLALVLAINVFCLVYFILRSGLVTDFTEPQNLFALAVNSPPSVQLKGSCGGGPEKRDLVVPWRVAYAPSAHHYFFEEANDRPWKGKYAVDGKGSGGHASGLEQEQVRASSYKRLSAGNGWM